MQVHFKNKDALRNYLISKIRKLERKIEASQANTLNECLELSELRQILQKNLNLLEALCDIDGAEEYTIEVD